MSKSLQFILESREITECIKLIQILLSETKIVRFKEVFCNRGYYGRTRHLVLDRVLYVMVVSESKI